MNRYDGLTMEELCQLKVGELADENCALFIWTVTPKLDQLFPILKAWNFRFINKAFSWIKVDKNNNPRLLPGYYTGSNTEDCYLAIRGKMKPIDKGVRQVVISRLEKHSKKPNEIRERIVKLFGDLPRLEIFSRQCEKYDKDGWVNVGNEVDGLHVREAIELITKNEY